MFYFFLWLRLHVLPRISAKECCNRAIFDILSSLATFIILALKLAKSVEFFDNVTRRFHFGSVFLESEFFVNFTTNQSSRSGFIVHLNVLCYLSPIS